MHPVLTWVAAVLALVAVPGARPRVFGILLVSASVQPAGLDRAFSCSVSAVCALRSAKLGREAHNAWPDSGILCGMLQGGHRNMAPTRVIAEHSYSVCDPATVPDNLAPACKIFESGTPMDAPSGLSVRIFGSLSYDTPNGYTAFAGCVVRSVADDLWMRACTCLHHADHLVPADGQ